MRDASRNGGRNERLRVTYVGHATLLVEMAGVRILTDPNFDPRLARFLPRVSPPGIALEELPRLDAILLTHAHADHLSFASLDALSADVPLFAPPPVARWLARLGYSNAEPLAPGRSIRAGAGAVEITAGAARHMGARYAVDRWRGAANTYLISTADSTCFFAGDTALSADCRRIVDERLPSSGNRALDVALLPVGYAPWWKRAAFRRGHLTPADALTLFESLGARYFIPYHWGTFQHITSGPYQAIRELRADLERHRRRSDVKILEPGSSFELDAATSAGTGAGESIVVR